MSSRLPRGVSFALLAAAFAFRLAYGLSSPFWTEDERQIYLIGLRSFARGEWPYFGADIVWTQSRVPGALQGWFVRAPLELWAVPEAPIVLLNIVTFAALALLAWDLTRRAPDVPRWLVWFALLTLPWTLNFTTHVVNTSYVLPGAILFFVGFFEAAPAFRAGHLPRSLAWAAMGLGVPWIAQMHMSWVLLPPYVLYALVDTLRRSPRDVPVAMASLAGGALLSGSLILPTILRGGVAAGGIDRTLTFALQGPDVLLTIIARFLSFTSFETNRFLGLSTAERLLFLWRQPWVLPMLAFVTLLGFIQPVLMAIAWFRRGDRSRLWQQAKWLTAFTILWIYASFFLSIRGPLAHAFYLVLPVSALYAVACWQTWVVPHPRADWFNRLAAVALVSGVLMHLALAIDRLPRQSLYTNRSLVTAAIQLRNDRFLGDRRSSREEPVDVRPRPIDGIENPDAFLAANPADDLQIDTISWSPLLGGRVSRFTMQIYNRGIPAYTEIRYETTYSGVDGRTLEVREHTSRDILQPGVHRLETIDGLVPEGATAATLKIVGGQKCVPLPRERLVSQLTIYDLQGERHAR